MADPRDESRYGRGHEDGLVPLTPLDPSQADSVDALVRSMSRTAFGGRRLGEAADVLEAMVRDEQSFNVLTLSGAMTIAKQGLVICELIERGWVHAVVSTGALMAHGLVESLGMLHFEHDGSIADPDLPYNVWLREKGYDSPNPWHDFANSAEGPDGEILSGWQMRYAPLPARVHKDHSETAYMTDRGMAFIEEAGDEPWCLHLSYIKPHWPYVAPAPYHDMYGANAILPARFFRGRVLQSTATMMKEL